MFGVMHFIYYTNRSINGHESRFNLFGLLTNITYRMCLSLATDGREPVTSIPPLNRLRHTCGQTSIYFIALGVIVMINVVILITRKFSKTGCQSF